MNKKLWIMCGPPGVGKSWFAKNKLIDGPNWKYVSRDEIRFSMMEASEGYFAREKEVYAKFINEIYKGLKDKEINNVIADATHLNWASRKKLLHALRQDQKITYDIIPVVVQADPEVALKRNNEREGIAQVPAGIIHNMIERFQDPKDDQFEYAGIMYVNNGLNTYVEKPQFMYHKNDIKMKEIPIKNIMKGQM